MAAIHPPLTHAASWTTTSTNPRPKGILRAATQTLGRRSRDEDDDGADERPTSPNKRRKTVAFDMQLNTVQEAAKRTLLDTRKEVLAALQEHTAGNSENYEVLKELFIRARKRTRAAVSDHDEDPVPTAELAIYVVALTSVIPLLGRTCNGLVKALIDLPWVGRDDFFTMAYVNFLAALVTGQPTYLSHVLNKFVTWFREYTISAWRVAQHPDVDRNLMLDRLHTGLARVIELCTRASRAILVPLIAKEFPHADEPKREHMAFLENALRMRQYAPDLGVDVLEVVVDRLVKIDVQMHVDLEDVDDDIAAGVILRLRISEENEAKKQDLGEEDDSDDESVASDDDDADDDHNKILKATQQIQKMDSILNILFELYTPCFDSPESQKARDTFEDLLAEFFHIVLPTQSSRHSQFLVFHFSQKSEWLTERFVGALMAVAFGTTHPMVTRQNATAYLASFVARAARVPADTVKNICRVMIQQIEGYRTRHYATAKPELRRHTPYYAQFQGLLYIFCFRWKDLVEEFPEFADPEDPVSCMGQDLTWMDDLQSLVKGNIFSKFNPLAVCHPTIVQEFAKLAGHLRFLYVHDKIGANRQVFLASYVSTGIEDIREAIRPDTNDESWLQLAPYFPFDPYQLPESRKWVDGDYIAYSAFPELDQRPSSDVDSDVDDEEGGGAELEREGTATDDEDDDD